MSDERPLYTTDEVRDLWEAFRSGMEWASGFFSYDEELRWLELGHRLGEDVTYEVGQFRRLLQQFEEAQPDEQAEGITWYPHEGVLKASDIAAIRTALDRFADDVTGFDET